MIITGVLKLTLQLDAFHLTFGNSYLNLPLNTHIVFIVLADFFGGFAFLFHALKTIEFKDENLETQIVDDEKTINLSQMSRPVMLTGSFTIIISLWYLLKTGVIGYSAVKFEVMPYVELFTLAVLILAAYGILPIILVAKNIALSNTIKRKKEQQKIALFHAKTKHLRNHRKR